MIPLLSVKAHQKMIFDFDTKCIYQNTKIQFPEKNGDHHSIHHEFLHQSLIILDQPHFNNAVVLAPGTATALATGTKTGMALAMAMALATAMSMATAIATATVTTTSMAMTMAMATATATAMAAGTLPEGYVHNVPL
jgi:hypothetical protein